ncbi:hypothetical protein HMI55_004873 [Coelomomyces lativittatus]|nr:hypothetical protein HMI55_004873 [Coelomomyces lativittatus]
MSKQVKKYGTPTTHPSTTPSTLTSNTGNYLQDFLHLLDANEVDDTGLTSVLNTLYNTQTQVYTWAGSQCMVGLSPLRVPTLVADLQSNETKNYWYKHYKNTKCEPWSSSSSSSSTNQDKSASLQAYRKKENPALHSNHFHSSNTPPHVYGLANNVYFQLRRTGNDQCIILR